MAPSNVATNVERKRRYAAVVAVAMQSNEPLLPTPFMPPCYLHCMDCGKSLMFCLCKGKAHGKDIVFVMDPIPAHFTVMQRIQRWAQLISYHPLLHRFAAENFVRDLPATFPEDLVLVQPILRELMDEYKLENLDDLAEPMGVAMSDREAFREEVRDDCEIAMKNFFAGNWGYLTNLEWTLLNNAIQLSGPEDFSSEMIPRIQTVFDCVGIRLEMFNRLGQGDLNYRLEDVRNIN
jgi:hypothetical protein